MIGLKDLEVYISIINLNGTNNKFKLYKFPDEKAGGVYYEKVRYENEKDFDFSDITATDLQGEIIAPIKIKEDRKQITKRMRDGHYLNILAISVSSLFQDFGNFLRTEIVLLEGDIRLVLDKYDSRVITYELEPGNYTFKYLSEALFNILQPEYEVFNSSVNIEFDDITMENKLVLRSRIVAVTFNEYSFFSSIIGFTPHWDYKPYIEYKSQKI